MRWGQVWQWWKPIDWSEDEGNLTCWLSPSLDWLSTRLECHHQSQHLFSFDIIYQPFPPCEFSYEICFRLFSLLFRFFSISERLWKFCSAFSVLSFAFRRTHSEQVDEAIKIFWDFALSWYQISPSLMTCLTTPKSSSYLATQEALGRDAETKSKPGQPSKLSSHVQSPSAAVRRCRGYQQQAILKPMVTLVNRFSIISTPPPHIAVGFFGFHFTLLCSNNTPQCHPAEATLFLPLSLTSHPLRWHLKDFQIY